MNDLMTPYYADIADCEYATDIKIGLEKALPLIKLAIENFDKLGDAVQIVLDSKYHNFCPPILYVLGDETINLRNGICDNFIWENILGHLDIDLSHEFAHYFIKIVRDWKKKNKITHSYEGFFIDAIDEYDVSNGKFNNLYRNPKRLNALEYFYEEYSKLLEYLKTV